MTKLHGTFITMFEEPVERFLNTSLLGRARENQLISAQILSILKSVSFDHHKIDDTPYGGGPGELMRIDIVAPLIAQALNHHPSIERKQKRVLLMDPAGEVFTQQHAVRLSAYQELIFVIGRYEGIDARIHHYIDESLSLGDFVLTSGDLAALAMFDATARMIDGYLGNFHSVLNESHASGRLEGSHYTRPSVYQGHAVPEVLKSGNHKKIEEWRRMEAIYKTMKIRPEMITKYPLSSEEQSWLMECTKKNLSFPWLKKVLLQGLSFPSLPPSSTPHAREGKNFSIRK